MKWIWSILICLVFTVPVIAQMPKMPHTRGMPHTQKRAQIEAVKVGYITRKLDLTANESQRFWPVYNAYQKELEELIRLKRQARQNANTAEPTEANADVQLNKELDFESRLLEIKKKYLQEFSKVLPSRKVLLLYQAEREFREELIRHLRDRRKEE